MARGQSLQDPFLNALRKERVPSQLSCERHQITGTDRFIRPVRRLTQK